MPIRRLNRTSSGTSVSVVGGWGELLTYKALSVFLVKAE
jgi:hypothetical protein